MTDTVVYNNEFTAALLPKISAVVTEKVTRSITPYVKPAGGGEMALWGENNDFPQLVIEDVRKDPEIGTLLNKKAELLYSGGLVYGKIETQPGGKEVMTPPDPKQQMEIRDWMRRSNIKRYLLEASTDLFWFANIFPEIVLSRDRTKILQLCVQAAETARWQKMDAAGVINNCYINANFPDAKESSKETKKVAVLDPYYDPAETLRLRKELNLIYPLSYPSPGSTYYQLESWNSIRASGWLAVSQLIPTLKKAILERGTVLKYHVEIASIFWEKKYPTFNTLTEAEKQAIKTAEFTAFSDLLSGAEQAGQSLFTPMIINEVLGKEYSLWKITPIDDKLKDGKFLEEGKDASLYKSMAVGLHPALVGNVTNSGMGGAGSNIREAYNLHMIMMQAKQDIILEPLYLVRDYNGWDPEIEFRFRNSFMNTLDKGEETTKTAA